jgi:hypothetical protein
MAEGVVALQPAEVVGRGPIGKTVRRAPRDVEPIRDAQAVFQIADACSQGCSDGRRQIAAGAPEAVPPRLLAMAQVQTLQGLVHRRVAGEAGPLMVAGRSAHSGLLQISWGHCGGLPLSAGLDPAHRL